MSISITAASAPVGARDEIAFLTTTFEPAIGGTVRQTGNQARALARRGYRVTVLTERSDPGSPTHEERDGLQVRRAGRGRRQRLRKTWALLYWTLWLVRHRRRLAAIQVIMHAEFLFCAALAGAFSRASILWVTRGDADKTLSEASGQSSRAIRAARRAAVRRAHNIVLTPRMAGELGRYGVGSPTVIPVPVDTDHFRMPEPAERAAARAAFGLGDHDVILLYSGHLEPRKGLHHLIDALVELPTEAARSQLWLLGSEKDPAARYQQRLHERARAAGIEDRVRFFDSVTDVRSPFLWAADLFVLPSEREGMPNALLEAMACGLPCVAPASAGGDELLTESFGVIPPSNQAQDLVPALIELLGDRERRLGMGAHARQAAERYSLATITDRYERLYTHLAAGPRRRRERPPTVPTQS